MNHKPSPQDRIAVIGAGPAGLAAAYYLKQKGYRQVTVLEASDRIGGKCYSKEIDGKPYELGAFTVTPGYRRVRELARRLKVKLIGQPPRHAFSTEQAQVMGVKQAILKDFSLFAVLGACLKYYWVLFAYRRILSRPGLDTHDLEGEYQDLCVPFNQWLLRHNMLALQGLFRMPVTDMGYGRFSDIATLYVLKYLGFWNFTTLLLFGAGLLTHWPKRFANGFESLWRAVAENLDVRCNVTLSAIQRADDITLTYTDGQTETFDHLIIACPPDRLIPHLDADATESELFKALRYHHYVVSLFDVSGMPNEIAGAINVEQPGHPKEIMCPWPNGEIAVSYTVMRQKESEEEVKAAAEKTIERLYRHYPVDLKTCRHMQHWHYFPHVTQQALQTGYYNRFEALQGTRRTYYTGSFMTFETVEHVVNYSWHLVGRHFA